MNEIAVNQTLVTMTSLEIVDVVNAARQHRALNTGKAFKAVRHDNAKRVIATCVNNGVISLPQFEEVKIQRDRREEVMSVYRLDKRSAIIVTAQLSPEFTAAIVDRLEELETRQAQIPTNATVVPKDLLSRCMYLGPKGRPTAQAKFLAKLMLPIIGQLGVTKEFGLWPSQLEEIERADRLALYAHQDQEFRTGAEHRMRQDQRVLEQVAKQKEKKKLQKQIANAQRKLEQLT
jgi:phage regulator Rha-like protein